MANYTELKTAVSAIIKTNNNQEITGQLLQDVLNNIISVIGGKCDVCRDCHAGHRTGDARPKRFLYSGDARRVCKFWVDGGQIVYEGVQFKNRVYVCSELGKPEYKFEEEGENRDGYFFPEKQISEKNVSFHIFSPGIPLRCNAYYSYE